MANPKLIVVDDEPDIGCFIAEAAGQLGFDALVASSAEEFAHAYGADLDVIVLDLVMPGTDGVQLLRFLGDRHCRAAILLISGVDPSVLSAAEKLASERGLHVLGRLSKPVRYAELHAALGQVSQCRSVLRPASGEPPSARELALAIEHGGLVVHYQPQFHIRSADLLGVEALVRWQHPTRGLLGPSQFVGLAERSGLIGDLTTVVLRRSLKQCRDWLAAGRRTRMSVNMSAMTMASLDLPERIMALIDANGLDPSQLILEVTETGLMEELVTSLDILTRLRMKGIDLSIDDFGTGYSSMAQLHKVPFSELKVDRTFITHADTDEGARAIVETTIMLGHRLGMTVVAEGVETQPVLDLLASLGCDVAQGYLLGRPVPGSEALGGRDRPAFQQDKE